MLLQKAVLAGIADGRITQVFRRWPVPRVTVGGTQLTAVGVIGFDRVERLDDPAVLTEDDARSAGLPDLAALLSALNRVPKRAVSFTGPAPERDPSAPAGTVFRIGVRWVGPDPRIQLRAQPLTESEIAVLTARLDRWDTASASGPWTRQVLRWIAEHPAVVSTELATALGRERWGLKVDIRKLKTLGLTASLEVGYRLSPRGEAYLAATEPLPTRRGRR